MLRTVSRVVLGVLGVGLLALVVGPRLYPFQTFYVRSASMTPTIPVGALVVATRAPAAELGPGDVIVFERPDRPGMMVVHRIDTAVATPTGRVFLTKGDANSSPDSWQVPATGEGWRAVYSLRKVGFLVGWLHAATTRRGWTGGLAIAAAIWALVMIWTAEAPEPQGSITTPAAGDLA